MCGKHAFEGTVGSGLSVKTTTRHYSKDKISIQVPLTRLKKRFKRGSSSLMPSTSAGCLVTLFVVGFCLGFIFLWIFEPLSWVIWMATGILLMFAFPILFTFDLSDKFGEENAACAALLGPVVGCLGFFLFLAFVVTIFSGLLTH